MTDDKAFQKSLIVREAEPDDIPALAEVHVTSCRTAYRNILNKKYLDQMTFERILEKYKSKCKKGKYGSENLVVADNGSEILGFCRYGERVDERDRFKEYDGEIVALYVKPDCLKQGAGACMLKYAMNQMKAQGKGHVIIWCLKENASARKFYEKMGGVLLGEKEAMIGGDLYKESAYGYTI